MGPPEIKCFYLRGKDGILPHSFYIFHFLCEKLFFSIWQIPHFHRGLHIYIYIYWIHQFMILSHHLSLFYGFNLYLISYQNYHVGSGALLAVRLFSILASSYSCSPSIFMSQLGLWFGCVLAKNGFMVHHLKFEKINDLVCENS